MTTKISFIIPTKDGGEGFSDLVKSIENGIKYAIKKNPNLNFDINFVINGNPCKPQKYLNIIDPSKNKIVRLISPKQGKVYAINYALRKINADIYILLDDDVVFDPDIIYNAIRDLTYDDILLVSYQPKARTYPNKNPVRKIIYDIINIRSLKCLYQDKDPFLCGRFLALKKGIFSVPSEIMLEDLYLSVLLDGQYKIRKEYVYYYGLDTFIKHARRVIMLETGRRQVRSLFPEFYNKHQKTNTRIIDKARFNNLTLYYRFCYHSYCLVRFITNKIIAKIFKHKTVFW